MSAPFSPDDGFRQLSRAEVEREITKIDLSRDGMIGVRAEGLAQDLPGDGRDLLHEAICRALTSRRCRETATVDQFLRGIMRSIASTARRSRKRRGENHNGYPVEDLVERMAHGGYVAQSAEDIIETERVRQLRAPVIEQFSAASKTQAALIESVGFNQRGPNLADYLDITSPISAPFTGGLNLTSSGFGQMPTALSIHRMCLKPNVATGDNEAICSPPNTLIHTDRFCDDFLLDSARHDHGRSRADREH